MPGVEICKAFFVTSDFFVLEVSQDETPNSYLFRQSSGCYLRVSLHYRSELRFLFFLYVMISWSSNSFFRGYENDVTGDLPIAMFILKSLKEWIYGIMRTETYARTIMYIRIQ